MILTLSTEFGHNIIFYIVLCKGYTYAALLCFVLDTYYNTVINNDIAYERMLTDR